jgi:hypothetical protein
MSASVDFIVNWSSEAATAALCCVFLTAGTGTMAVAGSISLFWHH